MCDYSLETTASRAATAGDRLVTCRFERFTGGFCAIGAPDVAVCLAPGTELAFEKEYEPCDWLQRFWLRLRFGKAALKVARFRKTNKVARFRKTNTETLAAHHDALEFPNGAVVLVTNMRPGQRVRVLQLPVAEPLRVRASDRVLA